MVQWNFPKLYPCTAYSFNLVFNLKYVDCNSNIWNLYNDQILNKTIFRLKKKKKLQVPQSVTRTRIKNEEKLPDFQHQRYFQ